MNEQSPIEIKKEIKVGDSLIMAPHELTPWVKDEEVKQHILMTKGTEPKNKLNGVSVKILEIKGENLLVSVENRETEIPKIFFENYARIHPNN